MKTSATWSVDVRDFAKGAIVAVTSGVAADLGESFSKGNFTLDYTTLWHVAAATFVAYLLHCLPSGPTVPAQQPQQA